jgi:hypothetical protein
LWELLLDFIELDLTGLRIDHHLFEPQPIPTCTHSPIPRLSRLQRQQILHELLLLAHLDELIPGHLGVMVFFYVAEESLWFGVQLGPELEIEVGEDVGSVELHFVGVDKLGSCHFV